MDGVFTRTQNYHTRYRTAVYTVDFNRSGRLVSLRAADNEFLAPAGEINGGGAYYLDGEIVRLPCSRPNLNSGWIADGCFGIFMDFSPGELSFRLGHSHPAGQAQYVLYPAEEVMVELPSPHHAVLRHSLGPEIQFTMPAEMRLDDFHGRIALIIDVSSCVPCNGSFHFADLPCPTLQFHSTVSNHLFAAGRPIDIAGFVQVPEAVPAPIQLLVQVADMNTGSVVHDQWQELVFDGDTAEFDVLVDWHEPGPWHLSLLALADGCTVAAQRGAVVYSLPNYVPKVFRPEDFWEFWEQSLETLRELPLETCLELKDAACTDDHRVYDVQICGWGGQILEGTWAVPREDGIYPVTIGCRHPGAELAAPRLPGACQLTYRLPGDGRFRTGFGDPRSTNLFHCYMAAIRWIDFLVTQAKADLSHSILYAGGRSGPVALATLALDKRVTMHIANVPTNNCWQWQVAQPRGVGGWGPWLQDKPQDVDIEDYVRLLAYFDPVNFAKRVNQPCLIGLGLLDQLSQVTGNLAVFTRLQSQRKKLCLQPWQAHDSVSEEWQQLRVAWQQQHFGWD